MDDKIVEALKSVMNGLLESANKKRRESNGYKDLFEVTGQNCEGLLRALELKISMLVWDAVTVIEDKFKIKLDRAQFNVLQALPFIESELSNYISKTEGAACSVDKAYYLLNDFILKGRN